jgi:thiamine pyrophosphokinase
MFNFFGDTSEKVCYIVGACECGEIKVSPMDDDIIICADGGLNILKKNNILPHVIIGDFDSLGYVPKGDNVLVYPSEKDDSDISIAIKYGFDKGYNKFVIFGGFGGRFDHTFANIQLLSFIADRGGRGVLVGDKSFLTVIKDSEAFIRGKGYISVFSLSDESLGVTLENLKYPLKNATLSNGFPLGLSNEFIKEDVDAFIRVEKGTLLIAVDSYI